MHPRAVDTAFAKAFNLLGKMGPRELRDKMEEMGYKPGTGLFKELLKSRGKSRFKDGGSVRPIIKVDKDGKIRQTGKKRLKDGTIAVQPEGGIKFIPNKKDGGLMEAIEKVKKEDATKMAKGGMARVRRPRPSPMRAMNRLDDAVEEFIETIEPFQGTVRKGETLRNVDGKTMVVKRMPNPNFRGNTMSDADRSMIMQILGARKMADGGKVPPKFKGFSKLPEDVQEQMNPTLAKKFKKGGVVKMGKGGGVCKGMGITRAGGKFKVR